MNKKILVLVIVILMAIVAISVVISGKSKNIQKNDLSAMNDSKNDNNMLNEEDNMEETAKDKKMLVVYYSAQSHTKAVAEKIAQNLNADIFEIIPEQAYTSADLDWTDNNSRVSKEHNDESLRNVKLMTTKVENWENYDTVLIGYPIWWGIAAWPVNVFVKVNDFTGKTVIPFCTSGSSGLGQSGELLKQEAKSGNWLTGHRFSSNASDVDITNWTDSLN